MELSVVICVKNGESVLADQLVALKQQVCSQSWEVVISDNGSTDGTRGLAESFAADFPVPLTVVDSSMRPGIPGARNLGALAARGAGIAFCDSDDQVAPGWVQAAVDALQTFDLVGGLNRLLESPLNPDAPVLNPGCLYMSTAGPSVRTCNAAVKRDVFLAIGGFDEALPPYGMEDTEFSYRLGSAGFTIGPAPAMVIFFRETSRARDVLSKSFKSGMAELLVWHRYPELFADRMPPEELVREFLRFFPQLAKAAVEERGIPGKYMVREFVNRSARLAAQVRWVRNGQVPPAKLLSERDHVPTK